MLLMKVLKCRKIVEFPEISIKKFKTVAEVKTASHIEKIILPPPTKYKLPMSLLQKFSYGYLQECIDICFPSALKRQFLGA